MFWPEMIIYKRNFDENRCIYFLIKEEDYIYMCVCLYIYRERERDTHTHTHTEIMKISFY